MFVSRRNQGLTSSCFEGSREIDHALFSHRRLLPQPHPHPMRPFHYLLRNLPRPTSHLRKKSQSFPSNVTVSYPACPRQACRSQTVRLRPRLPHVTFSLRMNMASHSRDTSKNVRMLYVQEQWGQNEWISLNGNPVQAFCVAQVQLVLPPNIRF